MLFFFLLCKNLKLGLLINILQNTHIYLHCPKCLFELKKKNNNLMILKLLSQVICKTCTADKFEYI